MKKLFLIACVFLSLHAQVTLDFLKSKPKGLARDFYIWQFLSDPKTSLQDSIEAYKLVFRKNNKLSKLLSQKGYAPELPKEIKCGKLPFEQLKNKDAKCIALGLRLSRIPSMPSKDVQFLIKKLSPNYPLLSQKIEILSSKTPLTEAIKSQNAQIFSEIFYSLNSKQRLSIFNQKISSQSLEALANQNHPNFNRMLQYILISDQFNNIKSSILASNITHVNEKLLMLLGVMQVKHNNIQKAQEYFKLALKNAKHAINKDKARFWLYLTTKDQNFLVQLSKSSDLNLYTIYANQKLKTKPSYIIISQMPDLKKGKSSLDITDPFEWQILRDELIKIPSKEEFLNRVNLALDYEETAPHKAAMITRVEGYKKKYFLMPYAENLSWESDHQKALSFAIARQESRLIPALVSTSYALGMMQIMPFNLEPFAKGLGRKNVTLDDLFNPQTALEFGRYYLKELENEFKHPLFVAYAYNGGPGFLRRTLKKKTFFRQGKAYEPWLSLELIPYEESKIYGPNVLANYIIYQELLGNSIDIEQLLSQTLMKD